MIPYFRRKPNASRQLYPFEKLRWIKAEIVRLGPDIIKQMRCCNRPRYARECTVMQRMRLIKRLEAVLLYKV